MPPTNAPQSVTNAEMICMVVGTVNSNQRVAQIVLSGSAIYYRCSGDNFNWSNIKWKKYTGSDVS